MYRNFIPFSRESDAMVRNLWFRSKLDNLALAKRNSGHDLAKRRQERLHLGLLADGEAHVIWHRRKQSPNQHIALLHRLDHRHHRTFEIVHDKVSL